MVIKPLIKMIPPVIGTGLVLYTYEKVLKPPETWKKRKSMGLLEVI